MFTFRSKRYSIFFAVFVVTFLPLSIHWEALRPFFQATRQWLSLLRSGNSLLQATRESMHQLSLSSSQTTTLITVHRVTAASPTCTITAPAASATVSGASTSVTATATGSAPLSVQFHLDGGALGSADASSPYGITWDTTGTGNGSHSLSCTTTNQYGETTTGAAISVTVSNDTTPPVRSNGSPSSDLASGTTGATLSLSTDESATCKYAASGGVAYASMSTTFGTTGGTTHSTAVTGLTDGNTYNYYIRCQDSAGNPNTDDYLITFAVLNPSGDGTPPSVPQNVIATPATTSVALAWDASTDNVAVTGYKIFRDSIEIATTASTSYTSTGLSPGTPYAYEIAAYDGAANVSGHSTTANTTTSTDIEAPSTPANLVATATSNTTISLAWDASTDNVAVTGYKIFRDSVEVGTSTGPSYSDANLAALTSYTYTVSAYDDALLDSGLSNAASATTTSTPAQPEEEKIIYEKPRHVLKQGTSLIARGDTLIQSGRRFAKKAPVQLFFSRSNGTYYPPMLITTDAKGSFSVSYKVNKPAGTYKWYAVEVRSQRKTPRRTYVVYDPKGGDKPMAPKKSSSSKSTHSS
jgi:chitodextrinase